MNRTLALVAVLALAACGRPDPPKPPAPPPQRPRPPAPPAPPVEPGFELNDHYEIPMTFTIAQEKMKPKADGTFEPGGDWYVLDIVAELRSESGEFRMAFRVDPDALAKKNWKKKGIGSGDLVILRSNPNPKNAEFLMRRYAAILGCGLPPAPPKEQRTGRADFKLLVMGTQFVQHQFGYKTCGQGNWILTKGGVEGPEGLAEMFFFSINLKEKKCRFAAQCNEGELVIRLGNNEEATKIFARTLY